jgi:hypothetical protein
MLTATAGAADSSLTTVGASSGMPLPIFPLKNFVLCSGCDDDDDECTLACDADSFSTSSDSCSLCTPAGTSLSSERDG